MTTLAIATVVTRRLALCALLMAIFSIGRGGELDTADEATDSASSKSIENAALEDAAAPPDVPKPRTPTHKPQARTSGLKAKQPEVSIKAAPIHVTNHHNAGSQFERIHEALRQGNTTTAIEAYESILKDDPRNTDALLGLALLHLRKGNNSTAEMLISKALSISPRNGLALALMSPLHAEGNTPQEESRLQQALAEQPDAAPLHFAIGNLYARQGRWREAQQAYFNATIDDRDHPDYLFNLAVSLERINQPQAAKRYYQAALAAAELRPAAFSRTQATNRIDNMDRSLP
ncbi:MAG TPA: tetratricopeptide repeat protein [Rhodocyclaceae bacterium]|nr:tetratricopeptide repeat protein [Rhodocyclaceae bacterium]